MDPEHPATAAVVVVVVVGVVAIMSVVWKDVVPSWTMPMMLTTPTTCWILEYTPYPRVVFQTKHRDEMVVIVDDDVPIVIAIIVVVMMLS
jgi:hypothetical protein